MSNKYIFIFFLSIISISLSACGNESQKTNLVIESSSVEIGSVQNSNSNVLHFLVKVHDSGMEPEQEYKVRFIIQDTLISELVATEKIEVPETYKTMPDESAIHTGDFRNIQKEFTIDEIKKTIKNDQAVIVELYDDNHTITREVITTFVDNRGEPLVKINPNAKIEHINLKGESEIAIFGRAVNDSTPVSGISYIEYPKYIFSLGEESYFLWITEEPGHIMNTNDTYTIYSLSTNSLREIKKVINRE